MGCLEINFHWNSSLWIETIEWANLEKILKFVYPTVGWIKWLKDYINYYKHKHALYSCKIILERVINCYNISTCHPYSTVAAYQVWKELVQENHFKKMFHCCLQGPCWSFLCYQLEKCSSVLSIDSVGTRSLIERPI